LVSDRCGGCGRRVEIPRTTAGSKYLCARCCHLQAVKEDGQGRLDHRYFLATAAVSLGLVAAAAFALCVLYLSGTGRATWFFILAAASALLAVVPSFILARWRNISLLAAGLYLPLGILAFLWHLAPGINWQMGDELVWSGLFFLFLGFLGLFFFLRDLLRLPRL